MLIEYRGYELHIEPYESGFKARIRKSGSLFDRPELPYSENKTQREQMIAEAMAIVDTLLDPPHKKNEAGIARRESTEAADFGPNPQRDCRLSLAPQVLEAPRR